MLARAVSALSPRARLGIILLAALALRLVILAMTPQLGPADRGRAALPRPGDEPGRGPWAGDRPAGPTSLRPPLYPALVAGLWSVTGSRSLQVVRAVQMLLGLATAALVFWIGRRLYDDRAGLVAAAIAAFYPALLLANSLLLTETLFTFLLTAFVAALVALVHRPPTRAGARWPACCSACPRSPAASSGPFPWCWCRCWRGCAPTTAGAPAGVLRSAAGRLRRGRGALGGAQHASAGRAGGRRHDGRHEPAHGQLRVHAARPHLGCGVRARGAELDRRPSAAPARRRRVDGRTEGTLGTRPGRRVHAAAPRPHALAGGRSSSRISGRSIATSSPAIQRGLFHPPAWAAVVATAAMTVAFPVVLVLAIVGACLTPPADWRSHLVLILLVLFVTGAAQRGVRPSAVPAAPDAGAGGLRGRRGVGPSMAAAAARAGA